MFRKIDDFLIDGFFQKWADAAREKWDVTAFWIAGTLGYIYVGVFLAKKFFTHEFWNDLGWNVLVLIVWGIMILVFERQDKRAKNNLSRTMSPFRIGGFMLGRMLMNILLVMDALELLLTLPVIFDVPRNVATQFLGGMLLDVLVWCVYYFSACSTKPKSPKPVVMPANAVPHAT